MPTEYLTPAIEDRAAEILALLADRGQHRAPSIPDLIIAATAELAGLTVLHLDKHFDLIAQITGQPMERLNASSLAITDTDTGQARPGMTSRTGVLPLCWLAKLWAGVGLEPMTSLLTHAAVKRQSSSSGFPIFPTDWLTMTWARR
jgi:hypothetical protein